MHPIAVFVAAAALVGLTPLPADAANPCRKTCARAKTQCFAAATSTFKTARTACKALAAPDARPCIKTAKQTRRASRAACVSTFKSCRGSCGTGGGGGGGGACTKSAFGDWLATVNGYRGLAGLPPVTENPTWSAGDLAHSKYVVENDEITHFEDSAKPFYTPEGDAAGQNGNVAASQAIDEDDAWAIDLWISGPFHAVGILDPTLAVSGFGIYHAATGAGKIQTAATLDVLRGRSGSTDGLAYPILFPGNGAVMPLDRFTGNETPDPLTTCGFTSSRDDPTGAPIIAQFATPPSVSATSLRRDGVEVEHCELDQLDPLDDVGEQVLAARNAVVIMPKEVLRKGSTYDVSITNGGVVTAWSFTVDCR